MRFRDQLSQYLLSFYGLNVVFTVQICLTGVPLFEKCPNMEFFSGPHFSVFIFSTNNGKYGPEKRLYLETFQAMHVAYLPTKMISYDLSK